MPYLSVSPEGARRLRVHIGHHSVLTDLPVESGGHDAGPTPTELFVAALASCAGHYALSYLARSNLSQQGLEIKCHYEVGEPYQRVEAINLTLHLPAVLTDVQEQELLRAVDRCTVHASIAIPAQVHVVLAQRAAVSA